MEGNGAFFHTVKADFKMGLKLSFLLAVFGVVLGFCFDNWQDLKKFFYHPPDQRRESVNLCSVLFLQRIFLWRRFLGIFFGDYGRNPLRRKLLSRNRWRHEYLQNLPVWEIFLCTFQIPSSIYVGRNDIVPGWFDLYSGIGSLSSPRDP